MREVLGLAATIATGTALPVWLASILGFAVALTLVALRVRSRSR